VAIAGRKRDMIIRQGLNIFPSELEEFLAHHPKIQQVAVIGLPHPRTGEQCVACIVPKPGQTVTKEELARFLEGKVAVFKLPERVEIMSELPMSAMGKVLKRVLQANLKEP
jgi:fatty-acyl-CoA synthase